MVYILFNQVDTIFWAMSILMGRSHAGLTLSLHMLKSHLSLRISQIKNFKEVLAFMENLVLIEIFVDRIRERPFLVAFIDVIPLVFIRKCDLTWLDNIRVTQPSSDGLRFYIL
jgi:hypothetical protein